MSQDIAIQLGREALFMVMLVSAPMLGLGLIVGVAVSIFQATTQIQEQTLSFVPKLAAIFITLIIAGNFMINILLEFTRHIFRMISNL